MVRATGTSSPSMGGTKGLGAALALALSVEPVYYKNRTFVSIQINDIGRQPLRARVKRALALGGLESGNRLAGQSTECYGATACDAWQQFGIVIREKPTGIVPCRIETGNRIVV